MMPRLITDHNWQQVPQEYGILPRYVRYGSADAIAQRMLPVDDYPDVLIPKDEWKERIAEAHKKKTMPIHHYKEASVQPHNQGNTGYCWAYGIGACLEALRMCEAQPYRRLGAASLGWLVNWQNKGYYLAATIKGASERGIASSEFVPDGVHHPRDFKDAWKEDALRHKPTEWFDAGGRGERDERQSRMVQCCVSLLLIGVPGYIAYSWWGHALMMAGVEWAEGELHNLKWIAWNSHGDGRIELTGHRGVPDEAYFPRSSIYAPDPPIPAPARIA